MLVLNYNYHNHHFQMWSYVVGDIVMTIPYRVQVIAIGARKGESNIFVVTYTDSERRLVFVIGNFVSQSASINQ